MTVGSQLQTTAQFGHRPGDLLKLRLVTGERVTQLRPSQPPAVEESENELRLFQATVELGEDFVVVENTPLSATLRQGESLRDMPISKRATRVTLRRNGSPVDYQDGAPLSLFAFPPRVLTAGDQWLAQASLLVRGGESVHLPVTCTVQPCEDSDWLKVAMQAEETSVRAGDYDLRISLSGRIQFCLAHGYLEHASFQTLQQSSDTEWHQWFCLELVERIGAEETTSGH